MFDGRGKLVLVIVVVDGYENFGVVFGEFFGYRG